MDLDLSDTAPLFGRQICEYGPVVSGVLPRIGAVEYRFLDNDSVLAAVNAGQIGASEFNAIIVTELLVSAHLAAHTSLIRASRWMQATWREYEAGSYLGWAACCRSLLEAVGDTAHSLRNTASNIGLNKELFRRALSGLDDGIVNPADLEHDLLHFSHARKLSKGERATEHEAHAAHQTTEYIGTLKKVGLPGADELYSELCQIGHPARASLSWLYAPVQGGFRVNEANQGRALKKLVGKHELTLRNLCPVAFNPGLLILRALVMFKMFPIHPELKRFEFNGAEAWSELKRLISA